MPERRMTDELRIALAAIGLCVAVFFGCFAIGRAERPKPTTRESLWSSPATAPGSASIPLALASVPRIDMRDASASGRSARSATTKSAVNRAGARGTLAPGTSSGLTTPATTQVASAPEATVPVSSSQRPAATTSTPDAAGGPARNAPPAKTNAGGSKSFDSSD
jgi:hypothetical protein